MLILYFIVLTIAIAFNLLHFPMTGYIFISSPLIPFIDIIIQLFRTKGDKETSLLSSVGVFLFSVFLTVKFLYMQGEHLFFWMAFPVTTLYIFRFFKKNIKSKSRFFFTSTLY
jgi:hypothetical protein